ncbi:MAG TPA: protein tyrosine phosphatase family protein [Anaerolineales bacterium]|nr:protein tyrosine phosphatase family protein [Anaerolineales bacterium]
MLEELRNFLRLSDKLISSGMPTAEQMKDAAQAGVKVVINLALPTSENALPNEGVLAASLGMEYINIPVLWEAPTRENLNEFMEAMDAHREQSVFVHCQANYRATGFITLYRVNRLGWKKEDALKDLRKIWNPREYPVWEKFIEEN